MREFCVKENPGIGERKTGRECFPLIPRPTAEQSTRKWRTLRCCEPQFYHWAIWALASYFSGQEGLTGHPIFSPQRLPCCAHVLFCPLQKKGASWNDSFLSPHPDPSNTSAMTNMVCWGQEEGRGKRRPWGLQILLEVCGLGIWDFPSALIILKLEVRVGSGEMAKPWQTLRVGEFSPEPPNTRGTSLSNSPWAHGTHPSA